MAGRRTFRVLTSSQQPASKVNKKLILPTTTPFTYTVGHYESVGCGSNKINSLWKPDDYVSCKTGIHKALILSLRDWFGLDDLPDVKTDLIRSHFITLAPKKTLLSFGRYPARISTARVPQIKQLPTFKSFPIRHYGSHSGIRRFQFRDPDSVDRQATLHHSTISHSITAYTVVFFLMFCWPCTSV